MKFEFKSKSDNMCNSTSSIIYIDGKHIEVVYHDNIVRDEEILKTIELYFLKGPTPKSGFYSSRCYNINFPNDFGKLPKKYIKLVSYIVIEHQKHFTNI